MPIPISDRLFIDYLRCKYKAYLKISGKSGVKSDFEIYQDDRNAEYRNRAREHLLRLERNTEPFILTTTFKDLKKQNLSVATAISISNDKNSLIRANCKTKNSLGVDTAQTTVITSTRGRIDKHGQYDAKTLKISIF